MLMVQRRKKVWLPSPPASTVAEQLGTASLVDSSIRTRTTIMDPIIAPRKKSCLFFLRCPSPGAGSCHRAHIADAQAAKSCPLRESKSTVTTSSPAVASKAHSAQRDDSSPKQRCSPASTLGNLPMSNPSTTSLPTAGTDDLGRPTSHRRTAATTTPLPKCGPKVHTSTCMYTALRTSPVCGEEALIIKQSNC